MCIRVAVPSLACACVHALVCPIAHVHVYILLVAVCLEGQCVLEFVAVLLRSTCNGYKPLAVDEFVVVMLTAALNILECPNERVSECGGICFPSQSGDGDGEFVMHGAGITEGSDAGFIKASCLHHKTAHLRRRQRRLLPMVGFAFSLDGSCWARQWLQLRKEQGLHVKKQQ